MTDRTVTVRLRMTARDYISEALAAEAANRKLTASVRSLGHDFSDMGEQASTAGKKVEASGRSSGRGLLYAAAGVAALGATGGALKVLPPLLAATATGAAALPGVLGATVAVAATGKIAFLGLGDAIGEANKAAAGKDPFARLAPNAKALVDQIGVLRPGLTSFQQGLQQLATKGTAADLELLANEVLPKVQKGVQRLAADYADAFAEISLATSDPASVEAFNTILASADRFFDRVNTRIRPTAESISTLVTAADPVVEAIGIKMVGAIDRFNAKVEQAKNNGRLDEIFEAGSVAAGEFADITGDVVTLIGQVISATSRQNTSLGQASDSLDAYIASGRSAEDIAGIVNLLTTAYEGLSGVVGPLGAVLRDALADPGTAESLKLLLETSSLLSQTLADMVKVVLDVNNALGGVPLALVAVALAAGKVSTAINLTTAAATRGATALAGYGTAGAVAGRGLTAFGAGIGRLVPLLGGLEIAHQLIDQLQDDTVHIDKLDTAVAKFGKTGETSGELARIFGDDLSDLAHQSQLAAANDPFANTIRSAEKLPFVGGIATDIAQIFGADTFKGAAENYAGLDTSLAHLAQTTGDAALTGQAYSEALKKSGLDASVFNKLIPVAYAELQRLQAAAHGAGDGATTLADRTKLLNAPIDEAVTSTQTLIQVFGKLNGVAITTAQAESAVEESFDKLNKVIKENRKGLNGQKDDFDLSTEAGRQNFAAITDLTTKAAEYGTKIKEQTGSTEKGAAAYERFTQQLRTALVQQGYAPSTIDAIINKYAAMPTALQGAGEAVNTLNGRLKEIPKGTKFTFNGDSIVNGKGEVIELKNGIKGIPVGKKFTFDGKTLRDSKGNAIELKTAIDNIPTSKTVTVQINEIVARAARQQRNNPSEIRRNDKGGVYVPRQRGGVREARDGLMEAEIAPPGTRYQWAEPETGGEAFVPRRGDRQRGRDIIEVAASWYDLAVVPMLYGGVNRPIAAANGLVNFAARERPEAPRATRLDYAESYLQARNAVKSLSEALRENGRAFSENSVKGRANRDATYAVIRAAQDAATTKFNETGSVKQANAAYDEYIRRLRAALEQQKVSSKTIRSLLSLAQRPQYDLPPAAAPPSSADRIAAVRSRIGALEGLTSLRDGLSLNKATATTSTPEGRENILGIIGFLEQAQAAAQDRIVATGSERLGKNLYNSFVRQLRLSLRSAGYSPGQITSLLKAYGQVTLTPNERGGVYPAQDGLVSLREAAIYPARQTPLYGFAEQATGGELFLPRNGDVARGRDLAEVGAGWYGGQVTWPGQMAAAGPVESHTHLHVTPRTMDLSLSQLDGFQRQLAELHRTGRRR